jgi:hypothetical protein
MTTKVYRDEESFEGLDKSSSSAYFDEQKLPEIVPTNYLDTANQGTRRTDNTITGSITIGGTTKVIETVSELQSAINNFIPTDGGTLYLKPGIYNVNQSLTGITGLKIQGESSKNTIIDFGTGAYNLSFIGTDMYTTGTVGAVTSGVIVTGVGTSWLSIENPSTKQLFMENKWYRISSVTNDTTLILSEGVTDTLSYPINYKIGKPIEDIDIDEVTIRNSGTTALVFTDCRDITLRNVITQTSAKGITMDNCFIISTKKVFSYSNASHGFEFNSCAFSSFEDMLSIGNGGNGFTYNNCKTMPLYSCAAISNVGNGINFTNTDDVYMEMELTGNGGQGAELVSGNKSILFRQCAVRSNISDGIKFTATSDECGILACNIESNGGYGINIANANCDNNIVSSNILKSNSTANGINNGTGTVIRGNVGWADNENFSYTQFFFGGDGSDGVGVADGSTALAGATLSGGNYTLTREVYYTNLTISNGVTVYPAGMRIFCTGTLAVNGKISRNGNSGTYNSNQDEGINDGNHGQAGVGGAALADGYLKGSLAGPNGATGTSKVPGTAGTNGSNTSNSIGTNGVAGGKGGNSSSYSGGAASTGGTATQSITKLSANWNYQSMLDVSTTGSTIKYDNSASAGSGGSGSEISGARLSAGGGGAGSAGGIIAIYAKEIIIGATGVIEANGGNGGAGGNAVVGGNGGGGGGGGGGNGGQIILAYTSLTNNGSITVTGGTGGSAGSNDWIAGGATAGTNGTAGTIRYFSFT